MPRLTRPLTGELVRRLVYAPVQAPVMGSSAPYIVLSANTIVENAANGTVIGVFSVVNGSGAYTWSEIADPGAKFLLSSASLQKAAALDWESVQSYSYTVQASNGVDPVIQQTFTIFVTNALEVTLADLTLGDLTADVGVLWSATISGESAGSTITATASDGTVLDVTGDVVSGTFETAGSKNVTLHETHPDASNSPHDSVVVVTAALVVPSATWVSAPGAEITQVRAVVPDGLVDEGDAWEWLFDTVDTFDSGDLIEVDGVLTSEDADDHEINATMPELTEVTWYAMFRFPGITDWSNIIFASSGSTDYVELEAGDGYIELEAGGGYIQREAA